MFMPWHSQLAGFWSVTGAGSSCGQIQEHDKQTIPVHHSFTLKRYIEPHD